MSSATAVKSVIHGLLLGSGEDNFDGFGRDGEITFDLVCLDLASLLGGLDDGSTCEDALADLGLDEVADLDLGVFLASSMSALMASASLVNSVVSRAAMSSMMLSNASVMIIGCVRTYMNQSE